MRGRGTRPWRRRSRRSLGRGLGFGFGLGTGPGTVVEEVGGEPARGGRRRERLHAVFLGSGRTGDGTNRFEVADASRHRLGRRRGGLECHHARRGGHGRLQLDVGGGGGVVVVVGAEGSDLVRKIGGGERTRDVLVANLLRHHVGLVGLWMETPRLGLGLGFGFRLRLGI